MLSHSSPVAATAAGFSVPMSPGIGGLSSDWARVLSPKSTDSLLHPKTYLPEAQGIQKGSGDWMPLGFMGACLTSAVALGAYATLIHAPQVDLACNTTHLGSARQQFSCAQQVASTGELGDVVAALQLTRDWSTHHLLYTEAQPLLSRWTETVLRSARFKYANQDQAEARWLVAQVPPHSADYDVARQLLNDWQQDYYRQGMALYGEAQRALQGQDWAGAIRAFQVLEALEKGQPELGLAKALSAQIQLERQAQHQLSTGIQLASKDTLAGIEAAVNHLSQIDPHTYAWRAAQPLLNRWGDRLLERALDHWYAGELHAAIHLSQQVVANPERAQVAQDLIWLSQSRQLVLKSLEANSATLAQAVGVYPALLVAGQISPESPFYPQAVALIPTWQSRLQVASEAVAVSAPSPSVSTPQPPTVSSELVPLPMRQIEGFPTEGFTQTNRPQRLFEKGVGQD